MKNISPFEIKSKEFKKSLMGLDPNEVRSYLKIISVEWQNFSTKLNELEEELINSKNEIQELKKSEKTLIKTLKRAEETGDKIISEAHKKSDNILSKGEEELDSLKDKFNKLKDLKNNLISDFKKVIIDVESQIDNLSNDSNFNMEEISFDNESDV